MNLFIKKLLLVSGVVLAMAAHAETKVAYVNIEQVMTKSAAYARAQKRLEKEFERRKNDLLIMQNKLRDMKNLLEKAEVTMSESERRLKERDWNNLNGEFQRKGREFTEDMNQRQGEELKAIQDRTLQIIRQIAEAEKYDLVVENALYSSSSIDLTQQVIKALAEKADK